MLGHGLRHELLLLRFIGKVPKCGDSSYLARAISHPPVKNFWEHHMHLAATEVIPSAGRIVQRIARSRLGSFADPCFSLTRLREQEIALKYFPVRFMATDLQNSGTREGATTKADNYESGADDSSRVDENPAAMEDVSTTGEIMFSQGDGQTMLGNSRAESGGSSAKDGLHEKVDELHVGQTLVIAKDSGADLRTLPEVLLSHPDGTDIDAENQDMLGVALSEAMEKFRVARGHPAKVYVHIKSFEKIRTGQLRNVRSAGLPVKRSLYTVNRSPHVDKKARDQFEMKVHKQLLVIETETHRLQEKLTELKNHDLPGVQLKVTFQYQTRLDKSLLG